MVKKWVWSRKVKNKMNCSTQEIQAILKNFYKKKTGQKSVEDDGKVRLQQTQHFRTQDEVLSVEHSKRGKKEIRHL